jgi:hypothetical protein
MKKTVTFLFLCVFSHSVKGQLNLYKPWLNRGHQSNRISLGICSPAGECSVQHWITLSVDNTFSYTKFDNQGCYGFYSKTQGTFEVKDSAFTLTSIVPDSIAKQKNTNRPLEATRFIDMTGFRLMIRNRKLYMIFTSREEEGFLLLKPSIFAIKE